MKQKYIILLILFVVIEMPITLSSTEQISTEQISTGYNTSVSTGYNLTWSDEFKGDMSNWIIKTGDAENAQIDNDNILLAAIYNSKNGYIARSHIKSKYTFKYGYIEFRGRLSYVPGVDNELWLMPVSGKDSPEIDILERPGRYAWCVDSVMYGHNIWDTNFNNITGKMCDNTSDGNYHIYALEWEPDRIIWYIDGLEIYRAREPWISKANVPMRINMALCADKDKGCYIGDFGDKVDDFSLLPTNFAIDYVRVYQR